MIQIETLTYAQKLRMLQTVRRAPMPADKALDLPTLHGGQQQVYDGRERFNVLECGRRFGKTLLGEWLVAQAAVETGRPCAWFAPTYKFLAEVFRDVQRLLAPVTAKVSQQEQRIELHNGASVDFWSLERPDAGRGRRYVRVIIDEAGIVRQLQDAWTNAVRPTLTDFKGDAWFLGTPKGRNYFHTLFSLGEAQEPGWRSWRLATVDNPYIDPDEIEAARRDLPEAAFRQEYLGIPADDGGNPFGLDAIRRCILQPEECGRPGDVVVWGVDLAKSVDWTVAIGLDLAGRVVACERWQGPWGLTKQRLLGLVQAPALVDSTGVGDPVLEDLQRESAWFEGFKFSSSSKQQIIEGLAVAIQQMAVRFADPVLVSELESFEYDYRPGGGVRYSAPAGLHDDTVCALALAWAHHRQRAGAVAVTPGGSTASSYWRG